MAPVNSTSIYHHAMNGTRHPHCGDHITNTATLASVDNISSSSSEASRIDDGSTSVTILGYSALALLVVCGIAVLFYWIHVYCKGSADRKNGRPAPGPIVSFPEFMVQADGRNSLGSSVRSDIGTNVSMAPSGLSTVHEEFPVASPVSPAPRSAIASKTTVKKPGKKSVFFTPEELSREEHLSDQATRY